MTFTGCTKSGSPTPSDLNIHLVPINLSLDPHKMEDAYSMMVVLQIHRGLLRYTPSGDVAPDLAEKWSESPDHKTYTLMLRPAQFSDGSPIEAVNVQMSFARLFFSGSAMGADVDYIEGASEFRKSEDISKLGIKVKSPTEIEFRLRHPSALFLKHLATADCAVLPIKNFKQNLTFDSSTPYSGPYKVVTKDNEHGVVIEKWRDDKLQSLNPPKRIHFNLTDSSPVDLAVKGKTDTLDHDPVSEDELKKLLSLGWVESATELISECYLIMNPKKVSKEIRQAIFSAINQKDIAELLGSKFSPAYGAIPRGLPGELSEYDIKTLRQEKRAKGQINIEYDPDTYIHAKIIPYIKGRLEAVGISVNLVPLTKRKFLEKVFASDCEVCIGRKGLDYPDGYAVLTYFKSGYPGNYFYVNDSSIDSLINEAARVLEKEQREALYKEIQKKVLAQYTLVPLTFGSQASGLWSNRIKKVPPHVMGYHMLPFETIEMKGE